MNVQLLKKIKVALRKSYRRVDMMVWWSKRSCGSVGCICGWAAHLTGQTKKLDQTRDLVMRGYSNNEHAIFDFGAEILGLTRVQSDRLFDPDMWPRKWIKKLDAEAPGTREYVEVMCDYIDAFSRGRTKDAPKNIPVVIPAPVKVKITK